MASREWNSLPDSIFAVTYKFQSYNICVHRYLYHQPISYNFFNSPSFHNARVYPGVQRLYLYSTTSFYIHIIKKFHCEKVPVQKSNFLSGQAQLLKCHSSDMHLICRVRKFYSEVGIPTFIVIFL